MQLAENSCCQHVLSRGNAYHGSHVAHKSQAHVLAWVTCKDIVRRYCAAETEALHGWCAIPPRRARGCSLALKNATEPTDTHT